MEDNILNIQFESSNIRLDDWYWHKYDHYSIRHIISINDKLFSYNDKEKFVLSGRGILIGINNQKYYQMLYDPLSVIHELTPKLWEIFPKLKNEHDNLQELQLLIDNSLKRFNKLKVIL